jgi:hypothetical protein
MAHSPSSSYLGTSSCGLSSDRDEAMCQEKSTKKQMGRHGMYSPSHADVVMLLKESVIGVNDLILFEELKNFFLCQLRRG